MVTAPPPQQLAPVRGRRWWGIPLVVLGFLPLVAVAVASFIPSTAFVTKNDCTKAEAVTNADGSQGRQCVEFGPDEAVEFGLVPADAQPAEPRLSISGVTRYDTRGDILFVTVQQPRLTLIEWWAIRKDPATAALYSYTDVYGDRTPGQAREEGFAQMRSAKDNAKYVALQTLGFPVELTPGPVVVASFSCVENDGTKCTKFSPVSKLLQVNDRIDSIDGTPIGTVADLAPILSPHKPGDVVTVGFTRKGQHQSVEVPLILAPDGTGRTIMGIMTGDTDTVSLPSGINLDFDTTNIGGPSAGLAFTLTLIDEMSPGSLTGGKEIAITGTIDLDGRVGAIGGLVSKTSAVKQVGAKYFIVPADQGDADLAAARKVAGGDLEIISVATLDEALAALQRLGGDPFVKPGDASATA